MLTKPHIAMLLLAIVLGCGGSSGGRHAGTARKKAESPTTKSVAMIEVKPVAKPLLIVKPLVASQPVKVKFGHIYPRLKRPEVIPPKIKLPTTMPATGLPVVEDKREETGVNPREFE